MTVSTDDRLEEVPEAAPLPAETPPPLAEGGGATQEKENDDGGDPAGPPPLPPLLETGASTLATASSGIYAAAGPAGLAVAAGVATVAGVAYGLTRHQQNKRSTAGRGGAHGRAAKGAGLGRFFGSPGLGGGRGRGAGGGGSRGAGTAGSGTSRRSSRSASGGGLTGAGGRGARGTGGSSRGLLGTGAGRGRGSAGGRSSGSSGGSLLGGSASRSGRPGGGRSGGSSGLFGGPGSRAAGGRHSGRPGSRGGGLFGGSAGRGARRSRGRGSSTSIIDPATGAASGRGRGRLRRVVRRGWEHPRAQRARVRARRTAGRARVRIRDHSTRLASYLRKRKWALRVRGWSRGFSDWWSGLWSALRGRASDPRYGPLRGWQLTAAAAAIGAIGAGKKKSHPRPPLVGRIIGTAAPVPGEDGGPLALGGAGRVLLALTEGDEVLAPEVQRVKDAADEIKAALAALGGSQVGMLTYEQGLKQIGPILGIIADGLKDMAASAEDEQPLDGSVLEFFGTIEDAARGASEVAEELPGLFRAAHEVELERLENPRNGEAKWDVSQQHH